ncbi:MAG TPA: hypothetical protein VIG68_03580 [Lysobacter sp.]
MKGLSLQRAHVIVEHALHQLSRAEHLDDAYAPFREAGARSRDEAQEAIMLVVASNLQRPPAASEGPDSLLARQMRASRSLSVLAARIACGHEDDGERTRRLRAHAFATFDEFLGRLRTGDTREDRAP